jgi:uncharacterized membrane protein YdbT with pleckstrin-like domain
VPPAESDDGAPLSHPVRVPYPDKVLGDDEEVVRHLHPHWLTVSWPVVVALVLALYLVARPLLRWRTTHYVITTHRVLYRDGVLARSGRDIGLSRITDVSFRQSLWDRVVNSGTVTIETAGEGATVLSSLPDCVEVQQLLNQLVEEDADRRALLSAGYVGGYARDGW